MILTILLTGAGFLLLARSISREEKRPWEMLAAFALLGASVFLHMTSGRPAIELASRAGLEFGIGMVLCAGLIRRRGGPAKPFLALGMMLLVLSVAVFGTRRLTNSAGSATLGDSESVSMLLELGPDDSIDELQVLLEEHGAVVERAFPRLTIDEDADLAQVYLVEVPRSQQESLSQALVRDTENVDHLELNRLFGLDLPSSSSDEVAVSTPVRENDPLVAGQWALEAIRAHQAHVLLLEVEPVRRIRLAIVDTGVDSAHEDIRDTLVPGSVSTDEHGHGSHCAGIAAGVTNNGLGIASLNWEARFVEIGSYAALDANGFGTVEQIAQSVLDATRDDADVISMSLGDRSPAIPKTLRDAVAYARRNGATIIAAAGNNNEDAADHTPSNLEGVYAVAAVDQSLRKASFSNTNTSLARPIAAPGVDILSLRPGGGYVRMSGTSMATPMVAGLVSVLKSLDPDRSDDDLFDLLHSTARTIPESGRVGRLIDAEAAVLRVLDERG